MRISDWSSDVCSSDLLGELPLQFMLRCRRLGEPGRRQGVHPIDCRAQEAHCSCLKMSLSTPALGVVIKTRKSIRPLRFFPASLSPCALCRYAPKPPTPRIGVHHGLPPGLFLHTPTP